MFGHMAHTLGRMTNTREIADRLEAARLAAGISREDLAVAADIPSRTLRRRMANPSGFSLAELISMTRVLRVPLEVAIADKPEAVP